jgi:hypothetical protein
MRSFVKSRNQGRVFADPWIRLGLARDPERVGLLGWSANVRASMERATSPASAFPSRTFSRCLISWQGNPQSLVLYVRRLAPRTGSAVSGSAGQ